MPDHGRGRYPRPPVRDACSTMIVNYERELRWLQAIQWTDHLAQDLGGHLGIQCRSFKFLVPEQNLDHADIDLLLQQVGGETVAQGVHRDTLVDVRRLGSGRVSRG